MSLVKLRKDIESLHQDLLKFVLARKALVDQVWELKKAQKLDLTDSTREQLLVEQFDQLPELKNDENLREFYQNIVKSIIAENKRYLKAKARK